MLSQMPLSMSLSSLRVEFTAHRITNLVAAAGRLRPKFAVSSVTSVSAALGPQDVRSFVSVNWDELEV